MSYEWALYQTDPEGYFARLDRFVAAAEEAGVGLIPSLFWNLSTINDLCDEPRGAWADLDSATIAFMRRYTREVVGRYQDSEAIWAWEFTNELNLAVDLPNRAQHRPRVLVDRGTRATRDERDDLSSDQMVIACRAFAETVRELDERRLICSGHSIPRPSAWHQRSEDSWTKDTRAQYAEILGLYHPDPVDLLSIHVYPQRDGSYFSDQPATLEELLAANVAISREHDKPLFVGEFGQKGTDQLHRDDNTRLLQAIVAARVPLAAIWVFDRKFPNEPFNIHGDGERSWLLTAIAEANRQLAGN